MDTPEVTGSAVDEPADGTPAEHPVTTAGEPSPATAVDPLAAADVTAGDVTAGMPGDPGCAPPGDPEDATPGDLASAPAAGPGREPARAAGRAAAARATAARTAAARTAAAQVTAARAAVARAGRAATDKVSDGDWARRMLARAEPPAAPAESPWRLSAGTLIAGHPSVPAAAAWLLGKLGRFGEVMVGPGETGFDGRQVPWERVLEIRTHPGGLVPDTAVSKELGRVRELLPPVPGRAWVLDKAAVVLLALALAARDHRGPREPREPAPGQDEPARQIVCEIVYRNRLGRTRQLPAGLFAAGILAAYPAASESIIATAQAHAVPVRPAPPPATPARADQADRLRAASAQFATRVRALATTSGPGQPGTLDGPSAEDGPVTGGPRTADSPGTAPGPAPGPVAQDRPSVATAPGTPPAPGGPVSG